MFPGHLVPLGTASPYLLACPKPKPPPCSSGDLLMFMFASGNDESGGTCKLVTVAICMYSSLQVSPDKPIPASCLVRHMAMRKIKAIHPRFGRLVYFPSLVVLVRSTSLFCFAHPCYLTRDIARKVGAISQGRSVLKNSRAGKLLS